jgi:tol-pal system protein YbgF
MKRRYAFCYPALPAVALALLLSGCAGLVQPTVARHEQDLSALQQSNQELSRSVAALRKSQAELADEIEGMRQNVQAIQGSAEQNTLKLDRSMADARNLQNEVIATLREKDEQLSIMHNRLQVLESRAGVASAPPAKKPANSVSGNSIENVWSPSPYSALAKKQAAGTGQSAPLQSTAAVPPAVTTPEGVYNEAYTTFKAGNYEGARQQFKRFLQRYTESDLADNAQFWIGESYVKQNKPEEAIVAFEELIKNYPRSNKIAEAYYKQALAFSAINDVVAARARLEMLVNEFPNGEFAQMAEKKLQELQQQKPAEEE